MTGFTVFSKLLFPINLLIYVKCWLQSVNHKSYLCSFLIHVTYQTWDVFDLASWWSCTAVHSHQGLYSPPSSLSRRGLLAHERLYTFLCLGLLIHVIVYVLERIPVLCWVQRRTCTTGKWYLEYHHKNIQAELFFLKSNFYSAQHRCRRPHWRNSIPVHHIQSPSWLMTAVNFYCLPKAESRIITPFNSVPGVRLYSIQQYIVWMV